MNTIRKSFLKQRLRIHYWLFRVLFCMLMMVIVHPAQALISFGSFFPDPLAFLPGQASKSGAVYSRAMITGANGRPIYVEYNDKGEVVEEIGEAINDLERARVLPTSYYASLMLGYENVMAQHPDPKPVLITASDYRAAQFKTVEGKTVDKPSLLSSTLYVVVSANQYFENGKDLILLQLSINPNIIPQANSKSLLLSESGEILHQANGVIGFKTGFYDKGLESDQDIRDLNATIYGPISGAKLDLGKLYIGGFAATDSQGKYALNYFVPPCPGFIWLYSSPILLELQYLRFNPKNNLPATYFKTREDYEVCVGTPMAPWWLNPYMSMMASQMKTRFDFPIDLMILNGAAAIPGVEVGDTTQFNGETREAANHIQQKYDFDGDGEFDFVVPGKKIIKEVGGEEKEVFVQTTLDEAELQGIYLTSLHEKLPENLEETSPDFTRIIDTMPDFQHRGLLSKISRNDLRDTDIYVFREANGQLVAERRGLHEDELYKNYSGVDDNSGSFRFTMHLRGEWEEKYKGTFDPDQFKTWQSAGGFAEEFQKKTANHLKAGETVRVIAINRPTGYIGTKRVVLQAWDSGFYAAPTEQIQLSPPNLKIWAERTSRTEYGIRQGEENKQMIASEGAGLGSDTSIAIYTEWLDHDGTPLPEALRDYGYTGRLAIIVATNLLAPVGANDLSQFQIKPGQQIQVIHLPEILLAKQHLYVQVAGQPANRHPDFSTGDGEGHLKHRPSHFVPFAVPLFDEESTELARQAYLKGKKTDKELVKPKPTYVWQYRPEFQFSMYDLNVEEIRVTDANDEIHQILEEKRPVLSSSDKLLEFYYTLLQSDFGELPAWSYEGSRELILAVGEQEIKATLGSDQTIRFDNFDHLSNLTVDDYLTIRLYANNDSGNTLWEYAFDHMLLQSILDGYNLQDDTTWYVTADEPTVDLEAVVLGYEKRVNKENFTLHWTVTGQGALQEDIQHQNETGQLLNSLTMPRRSGSEAIVNVRMLETEASARFKRVLVVPGLPAHIEVETTGQASAMESETLDLLIKVFDAHGNPVADGTSVDIKANQPVLLPEESDGTKDGVFRAKMTGDAFAVAQGKLTITAGGLVTTEIDFDVKRLNVDLISSITAVRNNQQVPLQLRVTKHDGSPAANILVTVSSDRGYFLEDQYETDSNGLINPVFAAGPYSGTGTWTFRAGFSGGTSQDFQVRPIVDQGSDDLDVDASQLMILGDKRDNSPIQYRRYDSQLIEFDYSENAIFKLTNLKNSAVENIQVKLGDLENPNLEPVLAYFMNDLEDEGENENYPGRIVSRIFEEAGLRPATGLDIKVANDHPMGKGSSYQFDGFAQLFADADQRLKQGNQTGFRLDFKATGNGEIFHLADGQRLSFSGTTLRYEIKTSDGTFAVEKTAALNTWHSVGGRYFNGVLELQVDDQLVSQAASGDIRYSGNRLVLGQGYRGLINSFKLFDWNAQPLLEFANGSQSQQVTIPAKGRVDLEVRSTRQLGLLQNASSMQLVRVAITASGYQPQFANVFSTDGYREIAGQYIEIFTEGGPPILAGGLNFQDPAWYSPIAVSILDFVVPPAYAWSWSGVWDAVKGAINFIVPLEDFAMLGKQLYYLSTANWEKFDAAELVMAALGVITVVPMMKPLKVVLEPLKKFMRTFGNKPIIKAIGGVVGRIAEEVAKGRTEKLISLLPYFLIMAEIINSPDAIEAIAAMVDGIESADDLWAWINYFNLPAEDWDGDEIPSVAAMAPEVIGNKDSIFNAFIPMAHAKPSMTATRINGKNAARYIVEVIKIADPKTLTSVFKEVPAILKSPQGRALRKAAHYKDTLIASAGTAKRRGVKQLKELFESQKDDRIDRKLLIALIAYIETSISDGSLKIIQEGELTEENSNFFHHLKIYSLYGSALGGSGSPKYGSAFQLMMLGYLHLRSQELDGLPVLDVERTYKKTWKVHNRRVDIVLGSEDQQILVEVKSLKWKYNTSAFKTKGDYLKEFTSDFIMKNKEVESGPKIDYMWRFQSFKNTEAHGPTSAEFDKFNVQDKFCTDLAETKIEDHEKLCRNYKQTPGFGDPFQLQKMSTIMGDVLRSPKIGDKFKEMLKEVVLED